jgi:hypothetical protein
MDISKGFDELQKAANADKDQVKEARDRRDKFKKAFEGIDDFAEFIASGSLARSTQREPINDVDVIIVFDEEAHPDWGADGNSAEDALRYTAGKVMDLLGATNGTVEKLVRRTRVNNHAVKCFIDEPDEDEGKKFTVDAMPALRRSDDKGGYLLVPEKLSRKWIKTDPERLVKEVEDRQKEWDKFRALVRVLKLWKDVQDTGLKSLTVEVLALNNLPEEESRPKALQRFFTAAETAIESPIEDPAGRCGEIQPSLDKEQAREAIRAAASASYQAIHAQDRGETDRAACLWRKIFGDAFPEPESGCAADADTSSIGDGVSIGGLAGGAVGVDKPRPVTDVPQG